MVLVSHKYKFIYIKNGKVAGTSVEAFFGKYCIDPKKTYDYSEAQEEHIDEFGIIGSRGVNLTNKWKNHIDAKTIRSYLDDQMFDEYFKFCVIRNPYDKMVSSYFFNKSKLSFKEFVKRNHCVSNIIIDNKNVCDYCIRFENLEEDIKIVCKKLKLDSYDLSLLPRYKIVNTGESKRKHWSEYYDDETKRIVYDKHKIEFELFGYDSLL